MIKLAKEITEGKGVKRLVVTWLAEVPVLTSFVTRRCGEELRDGMWLQFLPEDNGPTGSNVGLRGSSQQTAPRNSCSGN